MLTFVYLAYRKGFEVVNYRDEAIGTMSKGDNGVPWVSKVTLNPKVEYSGQKQPTAQEEAELHEQGHHYCYVANSVKTRVEIAGSAKP